MDPYTTVSYIHCEYCDQLVPVTVKYDKIIDPDLYLQEKEIMFKKHYDAFPDEIININEFHCKNTVKIITNDHNCLPDLSELSELSGNDLKSYVRCYCCDCPYDFSLLNFTSTQLDKGSYAKCKTCIINKKLLRYVKFPTVRPINILLKEAIDNTNTDLVSKLLIQGVNPNTKFQQYGSNGNFGLVPLFKEDGTFLPEYDPDNVQLTNPLRLAIYGTGKFGITDDQRNNYISICKILIDEGTDRINALKFYCELERIDNINDSTINNNMILQILN